MFVAHPSWLMYVCLPALLELGGHPPVHVGVPPLTKQTTLGPAAHRPPSGVPADGGFLLDRLEDALGWGSLLPNFPPAAPLPPPPPTPPLGSARGSGGGAAAPSALGDATAAAAAAGGALAAPAAVVTCCLARRSKPDRAPPRIVVLCGPGAVGRGPLARRLVEELPDRFGLTVSSTTRLPKEHEVDGRWAAAGRPGEARAQHVSMWDIICSCCAGGEECSGLMSRLQRHRTRNRRI